MGTLLESKEALRARALEVNLTEAEVDALIGNRVDSLARLAFAACQPGESPSDEQVNAIFGGAVVPNQGTYASIRRLIFEAQTLLSADLQNKVHKTDDPNQDKNGACRAREQNQRPEDPFGGHQVQRGGRVQFSELRHSFGHVRKRYSTCT